MSLSNVKCHVCACTPVLLDVLLDVHTFADHLQMHTHSHVSRREIADHCADAYKFPCVMQGKLQNIVWMHATSHVSCRAMGRQSFDGPDGPARILHDEEMAFEVHAPLRNGYSGNGKAEGTTDWTHIRRCAQQIVLILIF